MTFTGQPRTSAREEQPILYLPSDAESQINDTHNDASLCQVVRAAFFLVRGVILFLAGGFDRRVWSGPGVAWPKSWCSGCNPAALATESFPGCPPGSWALLMAARAASSFSRW